MIVSFTVAGLPAPQGSKTRTRYGVREDNPRTRPWRAAVTFDATTAMNDSPLMMGPLALHADFFFPRPKAHYRTGKAAGQLRDGSPTFCATKPDTDKLLWAIGDALTGIVCQDDAQFVQVSATKTYGTPRAEIKVRPASTRWFVGHPESAGDE
jgi:Holliday junction resolvase RusA-like endonuclease